MSKKIYYECIPFSKIPFDNFISDAVIGSYIHEYEPIPFEDINKIIFHKDNILIGSVDNTIFYFKKFLDIDLKPINYIDLFKDYTKREHRVINIKNINKPCFIKPFNETKSFTGTIITGNTLLDTNDFIKNLCNNYQGDVIEEKIIDILSEYRCYISNNRLIGIKHYNGDVFKSLNKTFVEETIKYSYKVLNNASYTLDFGIDKNDETFLIEVNDGWSIGNYGLSPNDYFNFVKNRWFQIIREKK